MAGVPGSPSQIRAAADTWGSAGARLAHAAETLRKAEPESWQGESATAFRSTEAVLVDDLVTAGERLTSASRLLASYATILAELSAKGADLRHSLTKAEARVARNPLDVLAALEIISLRFTDYALLRQAQSAADETARQLLALVNAEVGGSQHWWDPLGWWDDESVPDDGVNKDTLDDTNWDPAFVQQGGIGDCYALSTIMGYMRTKDGQNLLKRNIRWDAAAGGYWVTLYAHGNPKEYFVDKVYQQGVDQVDGHTLWWENTSHNVVSLYESALAQATSYDDINDGGTVTSAIEAISGRPSTYVDFRNAGFDNSLQQMSRALDSGSAVIATTPGTGGTTSLDGVTVQRPDGTTDVTDVNIVSNHAYGVERIENDGSVWVRNPWGPGNAADGGGLMHLTEAQFSSCFTQADFEEAR
jgi:hypothetical protein